MPDAKPNVLVFFTDQQRWDSMGLHGNPLDLTPNLDRFALCGTHCFNGITPQPVCAPARAVLQTGTYATQSGVWRNGIALPPSARTLAHHFADAGYATGYIGKWHLAARGGAAVPADQRGGYDDWLGANAMEHTSEAYRTVMYDNDDKPVKLPGYRVDACTDAAIRFIDRETNSSRPYFLFLSFLEPHFQNRVDDYPPPDGYRERYTGRWVPPDLAALGGSTHQHLGGYWGMVKRLDEAFGRLLDALRSLGTLDNTIVLFTTDHGCHFKTRNGEYKRSCHESSVRIPMVLGGGPFISGGRIQKLVSLVDLPPTLLDAAGLNVPPQMTGRSILPLLRGRPADWPDDAFIQISEDHVGRAIRTHRWKYSVTAPGANAIQVQAADEYIEECLYDLEADPYELCNLIGLQSHRAVADQLKARLLNRIAEVEKSTPTIQLAPSRRSGQRTVLAGEMPG
jgi:arylsulfatase A-like enzyme